MSEYVRQELLDEWIEAHDKQKARADAAEHALAHLEATAAMQAAAITRVEALCDKFERWPCGPSYAVSARAVRAALADEETT